MAGRHRTRADILERNGTFRKYPGRRREDLPGVGAFPTEPPSTLDVEHAEAWRDLVVAIEPANLTGSDVLSIEIMSVLLCQWRTTKRKAVVTELCAWLGQYGFSQVEQKNFVASEDGRHRRQPRVGT